MKRSRRHSLLLFSWRNRAHSLTDRRHFVRDRRHSLTDRLHFLEDHRHFRRVRRQFARNCRRHFCFRQLSIDHAACSRKVIWKYRQLRAGEFRLYRLMLHDSIYNYTQTHKCVCGVGEVLCVCKYVCIYKDINIKRKKESKRKEKERQREKKTRALACSPPLSPSFPS